MPNAFTNLARSTLLHFHSCSSLIQAFAMPARHHATVEFSTPTPKDVYNKQVYLTALVASMGAFIFGYDLAFIGTTITLGPFEEAFGLADAPQGESDAFSANIVSLLQAGCFFGSLAAAPLGDRLGRKAALMIAGVAFCIGSLMQTVSQGIVGLMFAGRAIGGLVSESIQTPDERKADMAARESVRQAALCHCTLLSWRRLPSEAVWSASMRLAFKREHALASGSVTALSSTCRPIRLSGSRRLLCNSFRVASSSSA